MELPVDRGSMPVSESGSNEPAPRRKAGRPYGSTKLKLNEDTLQQIRGLARIQCTQNEAAAVLGVHKDTFSDFLHRYEKAMEAWEMGRENGRASLRRNQFKTAETNPTMQIWLGKQFLGQTDKIEERSSVEADVRQRIEWVIVRPKGTDD